MLKQTSYWHFVTIMFWFIPSCWSTLVSALFSPHRSQLGELQLKGNTYLWSFNGNSWLFCYHKQQFMITGIIRLKKNLGCLKHLSQDFFIFQSTYGWFFLQADFSQQWVEAAFLQSMSAKRCRFVEYNLEYILYIMLNFYKIHLALLWHLPTGK